MTEWIAIKPAPGWVKGERDEIVAAGESKQEVRERLQLLELDPDDYKIIAVFKGDHNV